MDFDNLLNQMEALNENIENAKKSLAAEVEKGNEAQKAIEKIDQELQCIFNTKRDLETRKWSLQQSQKTAARKIAVIGDLLEELELKKNGLMSQVTTGICELADQNIGQRDGVYPLTEKIVIIRIKVNDRIITRLAPVCSRVGPGRNE